MKHRSVGWMQAIKASGELDSIDRINEILFGLIMVLTFTCSISAATAGREELSTILWSALGCNVAWGFVDAFMYLFSVLLERGERIADVRRIQATSNPQEANELLNEALSPVIAELLLPEHMDYLVEQLRKLPEPPKKASLHLYDLTRALTIFLLVFVSTFPVTLPFIFIHQLHTALRVSNCIALLLLFAAGVYLGKRTGRNKLFTGFVFAVVGMILVAVTMALGG